MKYLTILTITLIGFTSAASAEDNIQVRATDNALNAARSAEVESSATPETVTEAREITDDRIDENRGEAEARIQSLDNSRYSGVPATATTTIDVR